MSFFARSNLGRFIYFNPNFQLLANSGCKADSDNGKTGGMKLNYHEECEEAVNKQIAEELKAFYGYQAMASYFQQPEVGLEGFYTMFQFFSKEETEHAIKLIKFQNHRGGKVKFSDITAPEIKDWTAESAVKQAFEMETHVTNCLHWVHSVATKRNDPNLCGFIESQYIHEQHGALKELQLLLTRMKHVGPGLGIYILDKQLFKEFHNKKL